MKELKWLAEDVVIAIHQVLISDHGGLAGTRDPALLKSALSRPQQIIAYGDEVGIPQLAAAFCYGLARNHPFVDGNKRIALTAAGVFLELNGYELDASEADAVVVIENLAAGEIDETYLADWFGKNAKER